MPAPLDLAELYEAVFGVAPSHASRLVMRRMQEFLRLKPGDAFSRMLIVQLRSADQIEETRQQLQGVVDGVKPLLDTSRTLVQELERSSGDIARRNRRIPALRRDRPMSAFLHAEEMVDNDRVFPMLAHLGYAFRWHGRYDDLSTSERITNARFDLALFIGMLSCAMMVGAVLHYAVLIARG